MFIRCGVRNRVSSQSPEETDLQDVWGSQEGSALPHAGALCAELRRCPGGSRAFLGAPFLIYGFWGLAGRVWVNLHIQRCRGFRNALDGLKLQDLKCRVKIEGQDCFICIFLHLKIQSPSPAS